MQPSTSTWVAFLVTMAMAACTATVPPPGQDPGTGEAGDRGADPAAGAPDGPRKPAPEPEAAPDAGSFDAVVAEELEAAWSPGAVIAVVAGDTVGFLKAYGRVTVDAAERLATGARFQAGAAMPLVNALAAARMADLGLLSLDATLGAYAPDLHDDLHAPTLAQLLTQTAGLARAPAVAGRTGKNTLFEAAHYLSHYDRVTAPGVIHSTSPPGITLAAYMMQAAAGGPYEDVVAELIFEPLGMNGSTLHYPGPEAVTPGHAVPEADLDDGAIAMSPPVAVPTPVPPESALTRPVRGLYTTALDLTRLVRALYNDGVVDGGAALPAGVVEEAFRPRGTSPDGRVLTLGPVIGTWQGRPHIELGGSHHGHTTLIRVLPEDRLAVILLANREDSYLARLAELVLTRLLGLPDPDPRQGLTPSFPARNSLHLPDHALVGEYWNSGEGIELFLEGGSLRLRSGDWVLDVRWRDGRYHAVIPDGRSALAFDILEGRDGRLYMWLEDRVLAREGR